MAKKQANDVRQTTTTTTLAKKADKKEEEEESVRARESTSFDCTFAALPARTLNSN